MTSKTTRCCDKCRHEGFGDEYFKCFNPSCECHRANWLALSDESLMTESWDKEFYLLMVKACGEGFPVQWVEPVKSFIRSLLASEYDRGYKQGVKDEIHCLETSGEHGEAVKKLLASERSRIRKLVMNLEGMKLLEDGRWIKVSDVLEALKEDNK